MRKIKYFLILCCMGSLLSCGERAPISRGDMIEILTEMHTADATVMENLMSGSKPVSPDSVSVYAPIFKKYGYTSRDFVKSMLIYSKNPRDLSDLYDDVISALQEKFDDAKAALLKEQAKQNIWTGDDNFESPSDVEKYGIPITLKLTGKGKYVIQMDVAFSKRDSSSFPRMTAVLYSPHPKAPMYLTETLPYAVLPQKTLYRLEIMCTDTFAKELRINLVEYDTMAPFSPHRIPKMDISNFMIRKLPLPHKGEKERQDSILKVRTDSIRNAMLNRRKSEAPIRQNTIQVPVKERKPQKIDRNKVELPFR